MKDIQSAALDGLQILEGIAFFGRDSEKVLTLKRILSAIANRAEQLQKVGGGTETQGESTKKEDR